jgi:hypothetical protein
MKIVGAFAGLALMAFPMAAQALPAAPLGTAADSAVIQVAGGCGPGFHRGPYGGCRPNRYWGARPGGRCWWRYGRRVCRW